jgi:hypothetical protein
MMDGVPPRYGASRKVPLAGTSVTFRYPIQAVIWPSRAPDSYGNPLRGVSLLLAAGAVWCTANGVFDGCAVEFP